MLRAKSPRLLLPLLALLQTACSPEPVVLEPSYRLVEHFPQAESASEVVELAMGSPETASLLGDGFSYRELDRSRNRHFRWGVGSHSDVSLFAVEPRDLTLVTEIRPLASGGPSSVEVELNGTPVGTLELTDGLREHKTPLPGALMLPGENRVRFRYSPSPSTRAAGDRMLAAAWYRLAFEGLHPPLAPPLVEAEADLLFLPFGSRIDYYLRLPSGATLRAERWGFRGDARGRLDVFLEADGIPERRLAFLDGTEELDLLLELEPSEAVRLSLRATASQPSRAEGGVLLSSPAIWSAPGLDRAQDRRASEPERPVSRPNIIIYLVDTLRADRLGCYGHTLPVSPHIDRFAAGATLFEEARGQSTWTLASVASIFTGVWPHAHGVVRNKHRLGPDALTLAEILQAAGYATSAVVTNGYVTEAFGLEQGFDDLVLLHTESALAVNEEMAAWLERRDSSKPFFLYLHTLEPHQPYLPPEEYRERFAPDADEIYDTIRQFPRKSKWEPTESNLRQLFALYDAEIAANDAAFGAALDHLAAQDLLDDSLVIFVSDHGEAFHEHYTWGHGSNLFAEALNVPLIVKLPGQKTGGRVGETVQHIDLLPTLLDYLDLDVPPLPGRSLLDLMTRGAAQSAEIRRPLFAQTSRFGPDTMSVVVGDWKYIEKRDPKKGFKRMLYDWREDPGEQSSRFESRPILAATLRAAIDRELASGRRFEIEESVIDDALRERLRALGYLN